MQEQQRTIRLWDTPAIVAALAKIEVGVRELREAISAHAVPKESATGREETPRS